MKCTVSLWRFKSESRYVFGPFTESQANAFIEKVSKHSDVDVNSIDVEWINDPKLFGTGMEMG